MILSLCFMIKTIKSTAVLSRSGHQLHELALLHGISILLVEILHKLKLVFVFFFVALSSR